MGEKGLVLLPALNKLEEEHIHTGPPALALISSERPHAAMMRWALAVGRVGGALACKQMDALLHVVWPGFMARDTRLLMRRGGYAWLCRQCPRPRGVFQYGFSRIAVRLVAGGLA